MISEVPAHCAIELREYMRSPVFQEVHASAHRERIELLITEIALCQAWTHHRTEKPWSFEPTQLDQWY
jgi:hypothetical protein